MTLNCIVIDDDPIVIEQIKEYITNTKDLKFVKSYTNPKNAMSDILNGQDKIDILFTDIEMPELSGLELATKLRHKTRFLILMSGHLHYAIDGYDLKANGFLSKPIAYKKFISATKSIFETLQVDKPFIIFKIKDSKELVKIWLEEIIYIEANGNYVIINATKKQFTTLMKLSEIEERLSSFKRFLRIHKSFIISTAFIEKYQDGFIYLSNKKSLSVTSTYRDDLLSFLD
ncbi:LytTR family DNA-binding domain-containing protein [Pedobacter aquatilis]|uniref:LytR/AlgR family response regulator transcription factor n=1 Tax=Pedobacter aquatilis TaxID=351343 RepID=UPI0025B33F8E|nr:LytTR family DNA-binding domain-containing protein [Pedobacter aquatilis]MDN3587358.1 LytTR family DNA-binding domain-containing protein [Pedobacter aquatilis]